MTRTTAAVSAGACIAAGAAAVVGLWEYAWHRAMLEARKGRP